MGIPAIAEEILWDVILRNSWASSAASIYVNDCLSKCCKLRLLHNEFGFNDTLILAIVKDRSLALIFQIRGVSEFRGRPWRPYLLTAGFCLRFFSLRISRFLDNTSNRANSASFRTIFNLKYIWPTIYYFHFRKHRLYNNKQAWCGMSLSSHITVFIYNRCFCTLCGEILHYSSAHYGVFSYSATHI